MYTYFLDNISYSRDWCYSQWHDLFKHQNSCCSLIYRIAAVPILAIATFSAETAFCMNRIVTWIHGESSPEEEYFQIRQLYSFYDPILFDEGRKHVNRNRFSDILPNEPTRVKIPFDPTFYFNANWVLDFTAIASQGPLSNEIQDFWKMIWHHDVKTLVMLANPFEQARSKCCEYWKTYKYGNFSIKTISEKNIFTKKAIKIVERTIQVSHEKQTKTITQYHLQNWPDFGVVDPDILAHLVKLVAAKDNESFLVHCSAGVGRTGTFLAAYQAFKKKTSNIYHIAIELRDPQKGRAHMIQTAEQYALACGAAKLLISQ